jgi:hypothetical protein
VIRAPNDTGAILFISSFAFMIFLFPFRILVKLIIQSYFYQILFLEFRHEPIFSFILPSDLVCIVKSITYNLLRRNKVKLSFEAVNPLLLFYNSWSMNCYKSVANAPQKIINLFINKKASTA